MRFVVAIVAFVLAAAAIGLGVAQRTVLLGPPTLTSSVDIGSTPLTIVDAATLQANSGTQGIEISATADIMLAYGRTADVMAWVGDASYNEVGWDVEAGELTSTLVTGTEPAADVPSPVGSDLWLREFTGADLLTRKINAPDGFSVIIAVTPRPVDGATEGAEAPAGETTDEESDPAAAPATTPAELSITWPLDTSAPFSGPLVVGGIVLLLGGLGAFLWALVHARSSRGPRRSSPKLPKRPKPPRLKPEKGSKGGTRPTPELEAAPSGRRRAFVAATGLALGALVLTGCTTPTATQPAPLASETPGFPTSPVAVTTGQFASILVDVAKTVADSDEALDADLAAERLAGPALALRVANYKIRAKDSDVEALSAIPAESIDVTLPQQSDSWPRTVFAVASAEGIAPVGLMLTQATARENYKVTYAVTLIADVPKVAPAEIGAAQLPADNGLALLPPNELAAAYGDILILGEESASYDLFQADGDSLRIAIGIEEKAKRKADLPKSARIVYTSGPGVDPVVAFSTNDSGQLVAVILDDVETVRPIEAGAAINPSGQVRALLGKAQSTRGIVATYGVQLLFYVPPVRETNAQIVLLGYTQGLVAAAEYKS